MAWICGDPLHDVAAQLDGLTMCVRFAWRAIVAPVALALLGEPNPRLSSGRELRYGTKGSLVVHVGGERAGTWHDFETGEGGGVLDLVTRERGCDKAAAKHWLRDGGFLEPQPDRLLEPRSKLLSMPRQRGDTRAAASRLFNASLPVVATVAERYLDARGVGHVNEAPALRFLERCPHPGGGVYPAMLSRVVDADGRFLGIQRTYLAADGAGKAAVEPARASLGRLGGGAVRLEEAKADRLLVGEGIESTAAAMLLFNLPGWATLGTSGLKAVKLPKEVAEVVIAVDRDPNGAGQLAAAALAERLEGEGRWVVIHLPARFGDFNDDLTETML